MCNRNVYVPVTRKQFNEFKEKGTMVQEEFPNLKAEYREMLISQHCSKCWDFLFKEQE